MAGEESTSIHFSVIIGVFFSIVAILLFLTACTKLIDVYDLLPEKTCQDGGFRNELALTINNLKDGETSTPVLLDIKSGCMIKSYTKSTAIRPTTCNLDISCLCLCKSGDNKCENNLCVNLNTDFIEGDSDIIKDNDLLLKSGVKNLYITKQGDKISITKINPTP